MEVQEKAPHDPFAGINLSLGFCYWACISLPCGLFFPVQVIFD